MTSTSLLHPGSCACCSSMLDARFDRRRFLRLGAAAGLVAVAPSFAFAAEGNYEAMLLTCIDPRLPVKTLRYMAKRHLLGQYSQFSIAGAAIAVVAPVFQDWRKTFWDNLATSVDLHKITKVIAMDHRDCGAAKIAYGPDSVSTRQKETETHKKALLEFRGAVNQHQPALKVELGLMDLNGTVEMFS